MAKCPACTQDVSTPSILDLEGWSRLACPNCGARLEVKAPRSLAFAPLVGSLPVLGMQGHAFATVAIVLMLAVNVIILLDFMHPELRLRKRLPQPEIPLNINRSET